MCRAMKGSGLSVSLVWGCLGDDRQKGFGFLVRLVFSV